MLFCTFLISPPQQQPLSETTNPHFTQLCATYVLEDSDAKDAI